ncbi:type IV secretory system conjugative DNA transfer family protein [Candidatus Gottesmanbacteria bacterium]|nr:type IV secretory system conjugative DNA transfer family protein [Candidatus Gottesmanbacteria bacterium]
MKEIFIGENNLTGKDVLITDKDRSVHMHVIGTSGKGKSKFLEHMIEQDIRNRQGLILVDPHGDLYDAIVKYCVRQRIPAKDVVIIDPNEDDWAFGLNYLEYDPAIRTASSHTSEVMKGIAKVFGGEQIETMPQLQRWERDALTALVEGRLTVTELNPFMRYEYIRQILIQRVENREVVEEWDYFETLTKSTKESYSGAIFNRANKFTINPNMKRIFGQIKSTIDFREAMDKGKIILCNLSALKISKEEQQILGIAILDKIIQAGLSRANITEYRRKPFYVYLDEFGLFVSDDIATALQQLRKFNVRFVLAHQELEQLKQEGRTVQRVLKAVLSEPGIRVSFAISHDDAEILCREMFAGMFRTDRVKDEISQTKFWPKETTRIIKGRTETESESEGEGSSSSSGSISMERDGFSYSAQAGSIMGALGIPMTGIYNFSEGSGLAESYSNSQSSFRGSSRGTAYSETTVPFYEFEPFKEVSSRTYYSVDDFKEKFIAWLQTQPGRRAQIKIGTQRPQPIVTPFVEEVLVRQKDVAAFKEKVFQNCALPAPRVDQMIEERRAEFLKEAETLGLVEPQFDVLEMTPESMRHKV